MLLLEINEFSPELMRQACSGLKLPHLETLLGLRETHSTTDDKQERFGLDPWVQWVSIHTGKDSSQHQVKHLADLAKLQYPQIWETLAAANYHCGIWGAMNARLQDPHNIDFFLPDPW